MEIPADMPATFCFVTKLHAIRLVDGIVRYIATFAMWFDGICRISRVLSVHKQASSNEKLRAG